MLCTVRQLEVRKHGKLFSNIFINNLEKLQKRFDGHADKHYFCKRKRGSYANVCGKWCGKLS